MNASLISPSVYSVGYRCCGAARRTQSRAESEVQFKLMIRSLVVMLCTLLSIACLSADCLAQEITPLKKEMQYSFFNPRDKQIENISDEINYFIAKFSGKTDSYYLDNTREVQKELNAILSSSKIIEADNISNATEIVFINPSVSPSDIINTLIDLDNIFVKNGVIKIDTNSKGLYFVFLNVVDAIQILSTQFRREIKLEQLELGVDHWQYSGRQFPSGNIDIAQKILKSHEEQLEREERQGLITELGGGVLPGWGCFNQVAGVMAAESIVDALMEDDWTPFEVVKPNTWFADKAWRWGLVDIVPNDEFYRRLTHNYRHVANAEKLCLYLQDIEQHENLAIRCRRAGFDTGLKMTSSTKPPAPFNLNISENCNAKMHYGIIKTLR